MHIRDIVRSVFMSGSACIVGAIVLLMPTAASAALKYEPNCYAATTNLLLQLDGIRNTGMTKAHDKEATTWFNLVDPRTSATLNQYKTNKGNSGWKDNAYYLDGDKYWQTIEALGGSECTTIEVFGDLSLESMEGWANYISRVNSTDCGIWVKKGESTLYWKVNVDGLGVGTRPSVPNWDGKGFSGVLDKTQCLLYSGGVAGTAQTRNATHSNLASSKYNIGCSYNASYVTKGTFYSVRIYNRALTAAEIKQNYDLDQIRFVTGMPVTNVVVTTAVAGLEGNEGGAYAYDEDGYTFTAPQKATKDGENYICTGYTLETWNGSAWGSPVRTYGARAVKLDDTSAKVRLTWQWQKTSASAPVDLDPLFDNYVKDGLVLHLDGIRNVGANSPHDYSAKQWIDLVDGKTATFARDAGDASEWRDDGYYFDARSFAQVSEQLASLGTNATVQVVCEADTAVLYASKIAQTTRIDWPQLVGCNNNDALNLYYDLNNGDPNHQMTFKCASMDNAKAWLGKNTWSGRYATGIRDNYEIYMTQGTYTGAAHSTAKKNDNIAAATVYIGSAGNSVELRERRWFKGTIKAVRIYDRTLTEDELVQNRAIDEARFFGAAMPVTNVVVASSVRGVSGDAPEGAYALSAGGHTFSAPASVTVGDDTYSCTGYTLETWDGAAWGAAETHSGVLSVALTDTTAKVRLTWQWTHTAGPGYDAAFNDYATEGLVVHLDGIRNTGAEVGHDSAAKTWADLANDGDYAKFINGGDNCGWTEDGYRFNGWTNASYAVMNTTRTIGNTFTAQAVVKFDPDESLRNDTLWPGIFGTTASSGDPLAMYYNQNNTTNPVVNLKVANTQVRTGGIASWDGKYMTGLSDGVNGALFQTVTPDATAAFSKAVGTQTITFCGGNGDTDGYLSRRFNGIGKSARIYNRALTNAELEKNRAADEVRFFGHPATSGDLIVASNVDGLGGDLPNGAYRPAAGYTFTAPTEAVLDGALYELEGYTLETWDGTEWANAESSTGSSVTPDVTTASKRLTWNWAVKSRLTKIKDYDVGDYVQNGLYLHFDGIRNAGASADHNPDAATWANLGTGGASFDATFSYASNASAGDGWADDGYNFVHGGKFASLGSNPIFARSLTIQVVTDARETDNPDGNDYPTYFGSTNDYLNIYGFRYVEQAFFKVFNGNRVELSPSKTWKGKYLTAFWHYGANQIFQEALPGAWQMNGKKWRESKLTFQNQPFYIGGVYKNDAAAYVNERRLNGKIQAIRVYNRSLSDEELEHNRMVDEARFKGNLPGCNVTIDTKYGHGAGETLAEEVGNYKVEGSYTFSATTVRDFDDALKPVGGYYLETYVDGAWIGKTWREGKNSYMYDESQGKVRITWSARKRGLVLILR